MEQATKPPSCCRRLHRRLTALARERRQNLGHLVREACERQYGLADSGTTSPPSRPSPPSTCPSARRPHDPTRASPRPGPAVRILIDANIFMYAAGACPRKAPSVAWLRRVASGDLEAAIDAEVLREICIATVP
ncbi:MAG: hypothetical protein R3C69_15985 [Geminicoccaceae bacterium]